MCCGKFDLSDSELQALTKPEKRKYRIGRRPLLKGLGAAGLLAALGTGPGLLVPRAAGQHGQQQGKKKRKLIDCMDQWIECRFMGGSSEECEWYLDCCLEEVFPPDIRAGEIWNPFCPNIPPRQMADLMLAPDIQAALRPLVQLLISGQCLPLRESGPVLVRGLDAHIEVRHRLGQLIREQQASGPLGVEVVAEATQTCGSQFSHSLFVSWRVYGGRPPVQVNIEITDPSGKTQRLSGASPEGMVKFELAFPGGGSASVLVMAQDAGNATASGQSSVQLGPCR